MRPWLTSTGQLWKFRCFIVAAFLGLTGFGIEVLAINGIRLGPLFERPRPVLAAVVVGGLGFVWLCVSVRCTRCGGRPAWFLVTNAPVGRWLPMLLTMPTCPVCNDSTSEVEANVR